MSEHDGSIIIDTELDNTGFEKGSDRLIRAVEGIKESVDSIGDATANGLNSIFKTLQGIASQMGATATAARSAGEETSNAFNAANNAATQANASATQMGNAAQQAGAQAQQAAQNATQAFNQQNAGIQRTATSTSALEKDANRLNTVMLRLSASAEKGFSNGDTVLKFDEKLQEAENTLSRLREQTEKLGQTQFKSTAYADLEKKAKSAADSVDKLISRQTAMANTSIQPHAAEYKAVVDQLEAAAKKLHDAREAAKNVSPANPTEYVTYQQAIIDAKHEVDKLIAAKKELNSLGYSKDYNAWENIDLKIEKTAQELRDYQAQMKELEDQGKAFTLGADTGEYQRITAQLNSVAEALTRNKNIINAEAIEQARLNLLSAQEALNVAKTADERAAALTKLKEAQQALAEVANRSAQESRVGIDAEKEKAAQAAQEEKARKAQEAAAASQQLARASAAANVIVGALNGTIEELWGKVKSLGTAIQNVGVKALHASLNLVASGFKAAANGAKNFIANLKPAKSPVDTLVRKLTGLKTMLMTRIKRMFISDIFESAKESLQTLAKYSTDFDGAMSNITNSFSGLSANVASLLGNLIMAVEPILTRLINLINRAVTAINTLFALFRGKSTITVAKTQTGSYAASLDKTGSSAKKAAQSVKKFKNEMYGWDELTKQNEKNSSSGSGSGSGAGDMFEDVPINPPDWMKKLKKLFDKGDWFNLGYQLAEMIADALDKIPWEKIYKKAYAIGQHLAEFLNGVFANLHLADSLGKTIAGALNTALAFALGFLDTFDFKQFGVWWGTLWNAFVTAFHWDWLCQAISEAGNGIIDAFDGFFLTIRKTCSELGGHLAEVFNAVFVDINFGKLATAVADGINDLNLVLDGFNKKVDWKGAARNIVNGINTLLNAQQLTNDGHLTSIWAENGRQVGALIGGFVSFINKTINGVDWKQFGRDIGMWFSNALTGIDPKDFAGTISGIVNGIFNLIGGFVEAVDWETIANNIADGINRMIASIDFEHAGQVLHDLFLSLLNSLSTIAEEVDWVELGRKIGQFLEELDWEGIFTKAFTLAIEIGGKVLAGLLSTEGGWKIILFTFGLKLLSGTWALLLPVGKQGLSNLIVSMLTGVAPAGASAAATFGSQLGLSLRTAIGGAFTSLKTGLATWLTTLTIDLPTGLAMAAEAIGTAALGVGDAILLAYDAKTLAAANQEYEDLNDQHKTATERYCDSLREIYEKGGQEALNAVTGSNISLEQAIAEAEADYEEMPKNMWDGFKGGWDSYFGEGGAGLLSLLSDAFSSAVSGIKSLLGIASPSTVFYEIGQFMIEGLVNGITAAWTAVTTFFTTSFSVLSGLFTTLWANVQTAFTTAWSAITSVLTTAWTTIQTTATAVWTAIGTFLANIWIQVHTVITTKAAEIKAALTAKWAEISTEVTSKWTEIKTTITTKWTEIKNTVSTSISSIKSTLSQAWSSIKATMASAWSSMVSSLRGYLNNMLSTIRSQIENWKSAGRNLAEGLLSGLKEKWDHVVSWANSAASKLTSTVKSVLGVHSPSVIWAGIGENLGLGLMKGLDSSKNGVIQTAANLANAVTDEMSDSSASIDVSADATSSALDGTLAVLSSIADKFVAIANALDAIGGLSIPAIAAGTEIPYQTRLAVAESPAGTDALGNSEATALLQQIADLLRRGNPSSGGSGNNGQTVSINIDGREVFNAVVRENNRNIKRTGVSPLGV